ncbi:MAG: oxidoreductase [Pedobacter sp.]|nr:MAG: oxidoreductase [Pedobacter sp.]
MRGLSVVSDQVAWVSGSNGSIGRTLNGGKDWQWTKPEGYEKLDFRDIEAFDDLRAVIINAGFPAQVLLTADGGKSWKQTYLNKDSLAFLDGMDFWDAKNGIIFGDPIKNKLMLLTTKDGGHSWQDISANLKKEMKVGEAGFAASGTTIQARGKGKVWISTGGSVSNIYYSANYGKSWKVYPCPIIQGQNSTGPFSMDFLDEKRGIVVGGDYLKDKESFNNAQLTNDGGKTWFKPDVSVFGYRSGVVFSDKLHCYATGTSGTDYSTDGGITWHQLSELKFNAVKKAKKGSLILLAGSKGQIYQLSYQ